MAIAKSLVSLYNQFMAAASNKPVDVANRLRPVLLNLSRHMRREVHASGVSAGQLSLLAAIEDKPGVGIAELAERDGISMPSVCNHVDRLEASGLVTRRQGEHDRRRVDLAVTPEGVRVLKSIRSKRTAWLAARLDALTEVDLAAIAAAIAPLEAVVVHAE
jgi:DNA-binding MarR family transcriptional regulator